MYYWIRRLKEEKTFAAAALYSEPGTQLQFILYLCINVLAQSAHFWNTIPGCVKKYILGMFVSQW